MKGMFARGIHFDQPIGAWETSSVGGTMAFMFIHTTKFDQDLSQWNVPNVTSMESLFDGTAVFTKNYCPGSHPRSQT
jgi:surface protein